MGSVDSTSWDHVFGPKDTIERLSKGLQTWCEAHRDELTKDGKAKTHRFAAGTVSWRARPPKVSIRGAAKVLEFLVKQKLTRFIRVRREIDKEAMLKEPVVAAEVPGVRIGSGGEDFVIKPFETELEEVA